MKRIYLGMILMTALLTGCVQANMNISSTSHEELTLTETQSYKEISNYEAQSDAEESLKKEEQVQGQEETQEAINAEDDRIAQESISVEQQVENYMAQMSIEEKVGQLFMIAIRKDENNQPITQMNSSIAKKLQTYHVGGVILFAENIETKEQTQALIEALQAASDRPLWIGVDEEGGSVSRVGKNTAINPVPFKEAFEIGETGDTQVAYDEALRMGQLLNELGFNIDFAPVADIYNEPGNTVIGKRSFGTNQKEVTPMIVAFAKGLIDAGIQPVVKHFPGHGNTIEDSHEGIAYVNKGLEELEKEEMIPFKAAISEGIGAVMKGHLMVPDVDETTVVSLSSKWKVYMETQYDLTNTLVMTDAMDMGAVVQNYGSSEAAVLSVLAGNDIILMPYDLEKAYEGVLNAYEEGRITQERIDESVRKILSKKVAQKILVLA